MKTSVIENKRCIIIFKAITTLLICLLIGIGVFTYLNTSEVFEKNNEQMYRDRVGDYARIIYNDVNILKRNVEIIADNLHDMEWEEQLKSLQVKSLKLGIKSFEISDISGYTRSTTGKNYYIDLTRNDYAEALLGKTNISEPIYFYDTKEKEKEIICTAPIYDTGAVVGVLTAVLSREYIFDLVKNIKTEGRNSSVYIINTDGITISHNRFDLINLKIFNNQADTDENLKRFLTEIITQKDGVGYYKFDGVEKYAIYTPVKINNWIIVLGCQKDYAFKNIKIFKIYFIAFGVIILLILMALFVFLHKYIRTYQINVELENRLLLKNKLIKESTQMEKMRTEFFANVSHELRTPLNVILGSLQLTSLYLTNKNEIDVNKVNKQLKTMKQNCQRLLRLINNLIDTTKIDSGFFELHLGNYEIVSVVRSIVFSVSEYIKVKNIFIAFNSNIDERYLACDPDAVERIILNLLSNAIKYSPVEGKIYVSVTECEGYVYISVKDTGSGIPIDKQKVIFDRFIQVDKSLTRKHEGSGIGLSLVRSLVELHKGSIYVNEFYKDGSEFVVKLPITLICEKNKTTSVDYVANSKVEKLLVEFSDIYG